MPTTYVDYPATAAQTDFAFSFPYLEDEHVTVEIDGVVQLTSAYSIVTTPSTKVVLNVGATEGQIVRVRRKSQPDTNLVDFVNGSVLTESELDRAYLHNRYLAEEIAELNDASVQKKEGSDNFTVRNNRLVELADPVDAQDATTKNYVDTQDALQVTKTGDSMSGALAMGSNKITGLGTPTLTDDAATKTYVDAKVNQVSSGATSPPTKWVFTGTAGANTTYSVTGAEVNGDTAYDVSVDGSVLEPTTDYTVDPDTDTLTIVNTLSGGEDIVVIERGFGIAVSAGVVGEDQLQTSSVSTAKIQDNAVDNSKLANDAVDGSKIADDSIDSEHYVDGSIDTAHLADRSVTAVKISNTDSVFNVQTTGEVGIGTASPDTLLDVNGVASFRVPTGGKTIISWGIGDNTSVNQPGLVLRTNEANDEDRVKLNSDGASWFNGGQLGIGTMTPAAPLEVSSTTGGVVFPRLTTTQRDAISSPTDGETIFNTTTNQVESYNGSSWGTTGSGVSKWDSGWVDQDDQTVPVSVGNGATMVFNHDLGSAALGAVFSVYAAEDSSGTNRQQQLHEIVNISNVQQPRGITITDATSTTITAQLAPNGYQIGTDGLFTNVAWGTGAGELSHIRLVLIG